MRYIIFLLLFQLFIFAEPFKIGDKIPKFSLVNQFDKKITINEKVDYIIVSFERQTGKEVNSYLSRKESSFLKQNKSVFIANISKMPSIITTMFALPKMRDYKHDILLIFDENDKRFVSKDNKSTLYKLNNLVIKNIEFISPKDLKEVFGENK